MGEMKVEKQTKATRRVAPHRACSSYWPLFKHMSENHGLTLLDSEMEDICRVVLEMRVPKKWCDSLLTGDQKPMNTPDITEKEKVPLGVGLHGLVRRMGRWLANRAGLLVVTPETMLEWTSRSTEYNRVAGHYDLSDERLSGLNDGRSQAYLACCQDVQETNAPALAL